MLLEVEDLVTDFPFGDRRIPIVDHVSFGLEKGRCLAIVGESGCGKSMTAMSLMRLVARPGRVSNGRILLEGRDVLACSVPEMRAIRGNQMSMIFQEPMTSLNPVVRVGAQLMEALHLHADLSKDEARRRGIELFDKVGIPDPAQRFDDYPHQLSGGMRQRVMIAMALCTEPRILLADEPTTALDVTIQKQILDLISRLQRELETAVLLITHDLGVVNQVADDIAVMYAGRIVERGPRAQVLHDPGHPYTKGLLASLPGRGRPGERLHEIPGTVPSPQNWGPGCRFAPRNPECRPECAEMPPVMRPYKEGEVAYCAHRLAELEEPAA
ncbi:MAG: ABC transporter ATP-binding protein [Myxococcota bacterium]